VSVDHEPAEQSSAPSPSSRPGPSNGAALSLITDVAELRGVGPRRAGAFRALGLRCVADLLLHVPHRYETRAAERPVGEVLAEVETAGDDAVAATVRGEIHSVRPVRSRTPRLEVELVGDGGTIQLVWFNAPWIERRLIPGRAIRVTGSARRRGDLVQIVNPRWESLEGDGDEPPAEAGLRPIYPASGAVPSRTIEAVIEPILEPAIALLEDHLPESYRTQRALVGLADAYRSIHRPTAMGEVESATRRLAFDELLLLQLAVMLKHRQRLDLHAPPLRFDEAVDAAIRRRFPFTLTEYQDHVVGEIVRDLQRSAPMNRLLQGDVGAGKTAVALYAMLMAVVDGHQAAMMAPTELLAEQHAESIERMLAGSDVRVALLTGSMKAAVRRALVERLAGGEVDVVVGTHALLTETVHLPSLAVAVIDEQHRFGVHQRATLRAKAEDDASRPHVLVMTATPIPRTLSLTLFGDLDVSTIAGRPPGRDPVLTRVVGRDERPAVESFLAERVAAGEQGYVVVPAVEAAEDRASVETTVDELARGPLAGRRLAAVHGRLDAGERRSIMDGFRAGDVDVLVATTVIEVGVDVPNATVMVILDADRFGLAQLHQLRGRVGRGERTSLCVLVADPETEDAAARLAAVADTDDGFAIAEADLKIRGPGELFGARQSGIAPFRVADLTRDAELLALARADARAWIERDPGLAGPEHTLLKRRVLKAHGRALGLGDVG